MLFVVVDDVEPILVQHGRGGAAPVVSVVLCGLKHLRPHSFALEIEAEHAHVAEIGIHALAVGHRRFRGVGVFLVDGLEAAWPCARSDPRALCRRTDRGKAPSILLFGILALGAHDKILFSAARLRRG